ncbi:hypothetical protein D3C81_1836500 [compost metagenome]
MPLVNRLTRAGLEGAPPETVAAELGVTVKLAEKALYCAVVRNCTAIPDEDKRGHTDDLSGVHVDTFVARLKPKPQRLVRMLMAEYTKTEAAEELGITPQAVSQAIKRVRQNYEQYEKISA